MPKRARSGHSTPTNASGSDTEYGVPHPAKRCAHDEQPKSCVSRFPISSISDTRVPLTHDNLAQHTRSTSGSCTQPWKEVADLAGSASSFASTLSTSARSRSPARSAWDARATLEAYGINVDTQRALPADLQGHLDTVLSCRRDEPRSPNASRVVQFRLAASLDNEITGIRRLEPLLLFAGEDASIAINPIPMISSRLDFNLSRDFLPLPPPSCKTPTRLSQPQADTMIGYLSSSQAFESKLQTAFTSEEESALSSFTLNPVLIFPFLSSQWKSATGESHLIAHYQSARDGATIVRYLDEFYTIAYGRSATPLECAHVSLTCDVQALNIWLHWRELDAAGSATHHMKSIFDCTLRNEGHLLRARELLKNHIDYALDGRLRSLKGALPSFCLEFPRRKIKTTTPA